MRRVAIRSQTAVSVGDIELDATMFEAQINIPVMHQVVVAQMNARRAGTHSTKTRGKVRGGGAKPYRQKGTGRARQGSIRAPQFVGGGTVFGPLPRDHSQKVSRKARALALRSALSDRAREEKILVFEDLSFPEPKTKEAVALLRDAGVVGKVLLVLPEPDENVWKSFRNLPEAHIITVDQLNVYDVLAREYLVMTKAAVAALNARGKEVKPTRRERAAAGGADA
jgi:large subunit ribosomal protein L4